MAVQTEDVDQPHVPSVPDDIEQHSVVSFESVSAASAWTFRVDGEEVPVSFRSRFSVNTIDGALDAGLAGVGLTRAVSYQIVEHVRAGRLQVVLENYEPVPRPVHLVYARQSRLPLKLRAFIDFAVPRLREQLRLATL